LVETSEYIGRLRIVGGNLAVDFVNTVDGEPDWEPGFDTLRSYEDLVGWGYHVGILSEGRALRLVREARGRSAEAEAVHTRALALRDDLYEVFRALALGTRPPPGGVEALRVAETEALSRARLVPGDGGYVWEWPDERDLAGMLWPVVHAATGLLTSGPLDRLKACVGCRWLFIDESRNRSRRWCTMEVCGTHEKVRRYLERRATRRKKGG
jgi:predicted RNA-binding Zn ribbon-like protein